MNYSSFKHDWETFTCCSHTTECERVSFPEDILLKKTVVIIILCQSLNSHAFFLKDMIDTVCIFLAIVIPKELN